MKILLGLFFVFSVLLMEGTSLECETCTARTTSCSGKRQVCLPQQDACISWVTERTAGDVTTLTTTKSCSAQSICDLIKDRISGWSGESRIVITDIQCSKTPASSGSFILALSGLLLLTLLL